MPNAAIAGDGGMRMSARIFLGVGTLAAIALIGACSQVHRVVDATGGATGAGASPSGSSSATGGHGTGASSTSASGSTSTTSGAGGAITDGGTDGPADLCDGGEPACTTTSDCPRPDRDCTTVACASGCCVTADATSETPCGDNGGRVCDGAGKCVACGTTADCPASGSLCATATCSFEVCAATNAAEGVKCVDGGADVCDGHGRCILLSCTNGKLDGTETDIDCGGSSCAPCADGRTCKVGADCVDGVCAGTCAAPTCTDGVRNGTETDVDCGGSCPPCANTKHCGANADCESKECYGAAPGTCVSCADGVKDGDETGVDCGGRRCPACAQGGGCSVAADCTTGHCAQGVCCNTDCTATCFACNIQSYWVGTCTPNFVGDQGNCPGGGLNGEACNAMQQCAMAGPLGSGANGSQCFNGPQSCVSGACSGTVFGTCERAQPSGAICNTNAECKSASCAAATHTCN
jgi:hypothetical protein